MAWASYKACREFRKEVSRIVKVHFPVEEKYLLRAQVLDSSRPVTSNIAEDIAYLLRRKKDG
ncbi:MAG: four helix bundle protein [Lewinellaceae bacterium]|nr:four helix bundle protein [Phaeodactylibacter sp.]MCB0612842.1 four helix bundle protein [Phaeodactylibacter sp.]MCB9347426.1 four helix bundle protein [Lewinellaceae bacterium]